MKNEKTVKLVVEDLEERIAPSLMLSTPGVEKFLALGGKAAFGIGHHHHGGMMHGGDHHGHGHGHGHWWGSRDDGGDAGTEEVVADAGTEDPAPVVQDTTTADTVGTVDTTILL